MTDVVDPSDDSELTGDRKVADSQRSRLREQRLRKEETLRAKIRKELEADGSDKQKGGLIPFMRSPTFFNSVLTAIVIPLCVWLVGQVGVAWRRADTERIEAQARAEAAKAQLLAERRADISQMTPLIPHFARSGDERVRLVALRILSALRAARDDDPAVRSVYLAAEQQAADLEASDDPREQAEGRRIREALAPPTSGTRLSAPIPAGTAVTPALARTPQATPARVYIHIYDENQREAANALRDALRARGTLVPGVENVVRTQGTGVRRFAQRTSIGVRYYHGGDRPAAIFAASVAQSNAPGSAPHIQDLSNRSTRGAEGVIEIWLPCGVEQGCPLPATAQPRPSAS